MITVKPYKPSESEIQPAAVLMAPVVGKILEIFASTPAAKFMESPEVAAQCEAWRKEREGVAA